MQEYTKNCSNVGSDFNLILNISKYPLAKDLKICNISGNT
jgi:hypothetical protein